MDGTKSQNSVVSKNQRKPNQPRKVQMKLSSQFCWEQEAEMSGFVAKALIPIVEACQVSPDKPSISLKEAESILTTLLLQIDQRPLQSSERKDIQREITTFMKVNNITAENPIIQQFNTRLAYYFFPTISQSEVTKKNKSTLDNIPKPITSTFL